MADELTAAEKEKLNALTAEEIRQKQELGKLNTEELAYLQKRMGFDEKDLSALNERVVAAGRLLELYKEQAVVAGENSVTAIVAGEQEIELNDRKIKELEKKAKLTKAEGGVTIKFAEDEIRKLEIINGKLKRKTELQSTFKARQSESEQIAKDFGKSLVQSANVYKTGFTPDKIKGFVKGIKGGIGSLSSLASEIDNFGLMMIGSMLEIVKQAFDTEAAFRKATGASQDMARSMTEVYDEVRITGVSMEQVSESGQALFGTFTDFTMVSGEMRKSLVETSSVLGQLGVSYNAFAQGVQNSTKYFGQSAAQAEKTSRELVTFANELGVAPSIMAEQFAKAGPELAKFGEMGVKAFKDLAHIQKITGMEMSKVLAITNKFDTFEGAADQAGKLNAAMGGNFVNAMDLMMATDPAERFGMIRDSLLDAGLSFDDMSYYQKQFYTESLGLADTGDLAMMLSGNMDDLGGAVNATAEELIAQKEAAQSMQSMQEQLNALMASMVPIITPVIDILQTLMKVIMDNSTFFGILAAILLLVFGNIPAIVAGVIMLLDKFGILKPLLEGISAVINYLVEGFKILISPIIEMVKYIQHLNKTSETFQTIVKGLVIAGKVLAVILGVLAAGLLFLIWPLVAFVAGAIATKIAIVALVVGLMSLIGWLFGEDVGASNFLEGIVKIAHAFSAIAVSVIEALSPIKQIANLMKVLGGVIGIIFSGIESLGTAFLTMLNPIELVQAAFQSIDGFISGMIDKIMTLAEVMSTAIQSAFVGIATSGVDEMIVNMVTAINDLSRTKALAFTGVMGATAAAAAVTAAPKAIAAAVGGGEDAGTGGANQTVRQPISLTLNGKALEDFVLEVIGKEIIAVNIV